MMINWYMVAAAKIKDLNNDFSQAAYMITAVVWFISLLRSLVPYFKLQRYTRDFRLVVNLNLPLKLNFY